VIALLPSVAVTVVLAPGPRVSLFCATVSQLTFAEALNPMVVPPVFVRV
jgi:hypothetical protein